ncbi:MAG: hypothetical protein HQL32_11540 [Planctomycetes bacterium]|nr:hypothetical protein [Planctomycetota bacterium]
MTETPSIHRSFLEPFFKAMNVQFSGLWCVLHSYESLPDYSASDVDMAFSGSPKKLEELILRIAEESNWTVYQKLWYDIANCYYYILKNEEGHFLAIDFLIDNSGMGKYGFSTSLLTQDCIMHNNLHPIPCSTVAFCYKFTKRIVKQRSINEDIAYLKQHYEKADKDGVQRILMGQFGSGATPVLEETLASDTFELPNQSMELLLKYKQQEIARSTPVFYKLFLQFKRIFYRISFPCGAIIHIPLLPDGQRERFTHQLKEKTGILFRFIRYEKSGLFKSLQGLLGSTLVICPQQNFPGYSTIKTHWLGSPSEKLTLPEDNFKDPEACAEVYAKSIFSALKKRKRRI